MKLDFLNLGDDTLEYRRMIRLFDFKCDEAALIHSQTLGLTSGALTALAVHDLRFVTPIDNIKFIFRLADKDYGICQIESNSTFECKLTLSTWKEVAGYMSPFLISCDPTTFHWLDEPFQWTEESSDIGFLFSPNPNGRW